MVQIGVGVTPETAENKGSFFKVTHRSPRWRQISGAGFFYRLDEWFSLAVKKGRIVSGNIAQKAE
jgi:hypothetical protein